MRRSLQTPPGICAVKFADGEMAIWNEKSEENQFFTAGSTK